MFGERALRHVSNMIDRERQLSQLLNTKPDQCTTAIQRLQSQLKQTTKICQERTERWLQYSCKSLIQIARDANIPGFDMCLIYHVEEADMDLLDRISWAMMEDLSSCSGERYLIILVGGVLRQGGPCIVLADEESRKEWLDKVVHLLDCKGHYNQKTERWQGKSRFGWGGLASVCKLVGLEKTTLPLSSA
jgi:alanyl-tRNA synthetase